MDICQEIQDYVITQLFQGAPPEGYDEDYNLIDDGAMDSLAIMTLVTHIDTTYQVVFGDGDIVPENFSSAAAITDFIDSKL
ncbi:MAG: acyl carrier protein [Leucothrix sp.]